MVGRWEPGELRGSRRVLRAPEGEIPSGDSPRRLRRGLPWEHAEALIAEVEQVIAPLGLKLSPEKTRVSIDEGYDFLGFAIKRVRGRHGRMVIHTYPSQRSLQAVKAKVRQITKHTGPDQAPDQLLHRVNRVLRGRCNYFRHGVSSATFAYLRHYAYWRVAS